MRGLLVALCVFAGCGAEEEHVDRFTLCWNMSVVYCTRGYDCSSMTDAEYETCVDAASRACCGGEVCPDEASALTNDELDVCLADVEDLSCQAWASGYVPASCQ
jgi:hypothetical protein